MTVEQINAEEHTQYLHHDQQGSTRLITSEAGGVQGASLQDILDLGAGFGIEIDVEEDDNDDSDA